MRPCTRAAPGRARPPWHLARRCCPLLLRPFYRWGKAKAEPGIDQWQEALGQVPDQYLTLTVPMWGPVPARFVFKVVLDNTGNWRFAYAYTAQLNELSDREKVAAQGQLRALSLSGQVRSWWK